MPVACVHGAWCRLLGEDLYTVLVSPRKPNPNGRQGVRVNVGDEKKRAMGCALAVPGATSTSALTAFRRRLRPQLLCPLLVGSEPPISLRIWKWDSEALSLCRTSSHRTRELGDVRWSRAPAHPANALGPALLQSLGCDREQDVGSPLSGSLHLHGEEKKQKSVKAQPISMYL